MLEITFRSQGSKAGGRPRTAGPTNETERIRGDPSFRAVAFCERVGPVFAGLRRVFFSHFLIDKGLNWRILYLLIGRDPPIQILKRLGNRRGVRRFRRLSSRLSPLTATLTDELRVLTEISRKIRL